MPRSHSRLRLLAILLAFALIPSVAPVPAYATACDFGADIGGGQCRGYLTTIGVGTWTVPDDWSDANEIEAIGGGGGGGYNVAIVNSKKGGGGGGAYSEASNISLIPGASISYSVGSGGFKGDGGDTWFGAASFASSLVAAKGGKGVPADTATGALGGDAVSGIGDVTYSGGDGGSTATSRAGAGGGAGGPFGNGGKGGDGNTYSGGGGGGGGGGSDGQAGDSVTAGQGGAGGNNHLGTGGGAGGTYPAQTAPVAGTDGGGGGGSGYGLESNGADGGSGTDWDASHGSGGGGGGSGNGASGTAWTGGNGGLYGGGGGGAQALWVNGSYPASTGGQGIIVITYTPSVSAGGDITTGLVGYWALDDGTGSTAADSSGNGDTGTLVSGPAWVPGKIGDALQFFGSQSVTIPNETPLQDLSAVTISAWIKTTNTDGTYREIVRKGRSGTSWFLLLNTSNKIALSTSGAAAEYSNGFKYASDGAWHMVTGTFDGTTISVYLDGVLQITYPGAAIPTVTDPLEIGSLSAGNQSFTGSIDDVRVYDRALSSADITALYAFDGPEEAGSVPARVMRLFAGYTVRLIGSSLVLYGE